MMLPFHTLSNGRYTVCLTAVGTGGSTWKGVAVTRWHADPVEDDLGFLIYLRDCTSGQFWPLSRQPALASVGYHASRLNAHCAGLRSVYHDITAAMTVVVPPDLDGELRRIVLHNRSDQPRRIEVTSYAEVVLNTAAADAAHPAFSKLFIQTDYDPATGALLARRRPRASGEPVCWLVHALVDAPIPTADLQWETDRVRFIGRSYSLATPQALIQTEPLSGTVGNVLDPIVSLRGVLELPAQGSAQLTFLLGVAEGREAALALAAHWQIRGAVEAAYHSADRLSQQAAPWQGLPQPDSRLPQPAIPLETIEAPNAGVCGGDQPPEPLHHWNGYGGFSTEGRDNGDNGDNGDYVIRLLPEAASGRLRLPPQPWINILANPQFGCLASETGAGYTWSQNSRENRLTPWANDPVLDPPSEALYLRDERHGGFWSPLPGPTPQPVPHEVRHGLGYSRYRQHSQGLEQDLCLFVPREAPVKITTLSLRNRSNSPRLLSLFAYARLVLGVLPSDDPATSLHINQDPDTGALLAENRNGAFAGRFAFAALLPFDATTLRVSGDRASFIGRHASPARPAALAPGQHLDGRLGAGLDPCFALQAPLTLAAQAELECAFLLGEATSRDEALQWIAHYRQPGAIATALTEVRRFWRDQTGRVQIQTPSSALNLMVNAWLPYQILSGRLWARSAFYQSGGAFGFRDQLQDAAALLYHDPSITRDQLLLHAAHQFQEGDVLHWWHPPMGCGIRTRFSDDLLWLPYLTAFYLRATGDRALLDQSVPFLTARPLAPGEDEAFLTPQPASETGDLYSHCCRALDRSLTQGRHGLPLMGTGDWNDGMNRVGREGYGESVWLGFFLYTILSDFMPICTQRGDTERAHRYAAFHHELGQALNADGWDGHWYRRAWYDNGAVLGSTASDECRIDALVQAWAVLSKAAPPQRAEAALAAVEHQLINEAEGLIRLLTPPFIHTPHDPGYIKGYVAGVRENGGQYTHAALWVVRALAQQGRRDRAAPLLEMLTPIHHSRTPQAVARYRLEPFVVAADIYGAAPHIGRGGWSWYTGAAGWMLRVMLESILGLESVEGQALRLRPCIPADWPGFKLCYQTDDHGTRYAIEVRNLSGTGSVATVQVDETPGLVEEGAAFIPLVQDGRLHHVVVILANDLQNTLASF